MPRLTEGTVCKQCNFVLTYTLDEICAQCRYRNKRRLESVVSSKLHAMKDDEIRKERELKSKKRIYDLLVQKQGQHTENSHSQATETSNINEQLMSLGLPREVVEGLSSTRDRPPANRQPARRQPPANLQSARPEGFTSSYPFLQQDSLIDFSDEDSSPTTALTNSFHEVAIGRQAPVPPPTLPSPHLTGSLPPLVPQPPPSRQLPPLVSQPPPSGRAALFSGLVRSDGVLCTICRDDPSLPNEWVRLRDCRHEFHSRCLAECTESGNDECPNCRGPIGEFQHFSR